jgi:hypothetical protein
MKRAHCRIGSADSGTRLQTLQNPEIEIACLLTSANHINVFTCVRVELLQQQAESIDYHLKSCKFQRCPRWKSEENNARNFDQQKNKA